MNENNNDLPLDVLDRAVAELRTCGVTGQPKADLLAATIHRLESIAQKSNGAPHDVAPNRLPHANVTSTRRLNMTKLVRWSSVVAAMVLVAVMLASVLGSRSAAFGQVIEKIKQAKSVTLTITQQAGNQSKTLSRCYLQGDRMRMDLTFRADREAALPNNVMIVDFKKPEVLDLDLDDKTFQQNDGLNKEAMQRFGSPLKWLAEVTNENVELVGEEELDGHTCQVYQLKKIEYPLGAGRIDGHKTNRIWVDPKTGLPVKIVLNFFDTENNRNTEDVYDNFRWNEPIAEELFSMAIPDGFKAAGGGGGEEVVPPFAEVLKKIKKASTVVFTSKHRVSSEPVEQQKYYYMGDLMRIESQKNNGPHVLVINSKTGEAINILPAQRTAVRFKFPNAFPGHPMKSLLDLTAQTAEKDVQLIGDEELNGRKTRVYRVTFRDSKQTLTGETAKIWIDPATGLPIQTKSAYIKPDDPMKQVQISGECENFEWNVPLKLELFQIPQGYSVEDDAPGQLAPVRPVN